MDSGISLKRKALLISEGSSPFFGTSRIYPIQNEPPPGGSNHLARFSQGFDKTLR